MEKEIGYIVFCLISLLTMFHTYQTPSTGTYLKIYVSEMKKIYLYLKIKSTITSLVLPGKHKIYLFVARIF